jgi:hypothetical protein
VEVEIFRDGRKLRVGTDGEVGVIGKGPLEVVVTVVPAMNVLGYYIDDRKESKILQREDTSEGRVYRRQTEVLLTQGAGSRHVPYPDPKTANGFIRLLHVTGDGGALMWAISLIAQDGRMYLVYQRMFSEQFYQGDNGQAVAPGVERVDKWKSTVALVQWWLGENPVQLPPLSEYVPVPQVEVPAGDDHLTGTVEWYALGMQMGAVKTKGGSVLVKGDQITTERPGDQLRFLLAGERVKARAIVPSKGAFTHAFQGVEILG